MVEEKMEIVRTKSGRPAIWVGGGGFSNTGRARVACGNNGEPLRPYYVRRGGHLASSMQQALVPVAAGFYIIEASHHRRDFTINVFIVKSVEDNTATLERVAGFDMGEWDTQPPEFIRSAIEAAKNQAVWYHCRDPPYVSQN